MANHGQRYNAKLLFTIQKVGYVVDNEPTFDGQHKIGMQAGAAGFEPATPAVTGISKDRPSGNFNDCLRCPLSRNSYTGCDTSVTSRHAIKSRGFGGEVGLDVFNCLAGEIGLEPGLGFQLWANLLLVIVTWHQRPTMNHCATFLDGHPGLRPPLIPFLNVAVVTSQPP